MKRFVCMLVLCVLLLSGCSGSIPIETHNAVIAERDEAVAQITALEDEITATNEKLARVASDLKDSEAENNDNLKKIIAANNEKDLIANEYKQYISDNEEFLALTQAEKDAKIEVAKKKDEISSLESSEKTLKAEVEKIQESINKLTENKAALETEIDALKSRIIEYKEAPPQLKNGNYTAGIDFPAGVYDIYAVAGKGTVTTSNGDYSNYFSEMMAAKESQYYMSSFMNVRIETGTVLKVSGVTIELREKAS